MLLDVTLYLWEFFLDLRVWSNFPPLIIQTHNPSEEIQFLLIVQTRRPTFAHAALPAWLVFSIFALQNSCPSFKIQFKY